MTEQKQRRYRATGTHPYQPPFSLSLSRSSLTLSVPFSRLHSLLFFSFFRTFRYNLPRLLLRPFFLPRSFSFRQTWRVFPPSCTLSLFLSSSLSLPRFSHFSHTAFVHFIFAHTLSFSSSLPVHLLPSLSTWPYFLSFSSSPPSDEPSWTRSPPLPSCLVKRVYYDLYSFQRGLHFVSFESTSIDHGIFSPQLWGEKSSAVTSVGFFSRSSYLGGDPLPPPSPPPAKNSFEIPPPFPTSLTFAAQSSPIRNNFPPSGQSCNLLWYLQPSLLSPVSFTKRRKNETLFSRDEDPISWENIPSTSLSYFSKFV